MAKKLSAMDAAFSDWWEDNDLLFARAPTKAAKAKVGFEAGWMAAFEQVLRREASNKLDEVGNFDPYGNP